MTHALGLLIPLALLVASPRADAAARPNVLWLVCEDAGVDWIGCYGNPHAKTPHIDALAAQGHRYLHAYASCPVCAPSRSTWITGVNAASTGTEPMRSRNRIPHATLNYYPDSLRAAGYYCANHTKTDYNIGGRPDGDCWDSKTARAWAECRPGQPFFQVVNYNQSHESSAHGPVGGTRHAPADVRMAKYHPDDPTVRQNYAKYHDAVEAMDAAVGKTLAELAAAKHADDTVVVFCSDHGGVLPRSKRFLYESGLHCPLIVRVPDKYRQFRPAPTPGVVDRLVSFVDLPKTFLSLAGAAVPEAMQGRVVLGPAAEPEPEYAFSFRGRMDERVDCQRSARTKRFAYVRNYLPRVPNGQHLDYLWKMAATRRWEQLYNNGKLDAAGARFFEPKPSEELYDSHADPDNVVNLAGRPEHAKTLQSLRAALRTWQLEIRDAGLLPEAECAARAAAHGVTIYELARDPKRYDLPAYLDAADRSAAGDAAACAALLRSPDAGLRYWGAVGLANAGRCDAAARAALEARLGDPSGDVAAMAAWALARAGEREPAAAALDRLLVARSPAALTALNVVDWAGLDPAAFAAGFDAVSRGAGPAAEYEQRMVEYLRSKRGAKVSNP